MSEKNKEVENEITDIDLKVKLGMNQNNQVEFEINEHTDIDSNIDKILFYMDRINLISSLSSLRYKYTNLFSISLEKVEFGTPIRDWSEWERVALILFTRHPFATNKDYIWKHEITAKNLNTHLVQKDDYFKKFNKKQIGLTDLGYSYILNNGSSHNIFNRVLAKNIYALYAWLFLLFL